MAEGLPGGILGEEQENPDTEPRSGVRKDSGRPASTSVMLVTVPPQVGAESRQCGIRSS